MSEASRRWAGDLLHVPPKAGAVTVYGLCWIETGLVFYIGQTQETAQRYGAHLRRWPGCAMFVIETTGVDDALARERYWIDAYATAGAELKNAYEWGWEGTVKKIKRRTAPRKAVGWKKRRAAFAQAILDGQAAEEAGRARRRAREAAARAPGTGEPIAGAGVTGQIQD